MEIKHTGTVVFEDKTFRYTGHAFISEGAILSIQLSYCNQVPHSAQLLAFVGRYPKDRIAWAKGTWHGLDEKLTPSTRNIILINNTGDIPPDQLIEIESSKKNLGLKD